MAAGIQHTEVGNEIGGRLVQKANATLSGLIVVAVFRSLV